MEDVFQEILIGFVIIIFSTGNLISYCKTICKLCSTTAERKEVERNLSVLCRRRLSQAICLTMHIIFPSIRCKHISARQECVYAYTYFILI